MVTLVNAVGTAVDTRLRRVERADRYERGGPPAAALPGLLVRRVGQQPGQHAGAGMECASGAGLVLARRAAVRPTAAALLTTRPLDAGQPARLRVRQ